MSDGEVDFDADELAMLRQLFRSEAHEALELVTTRLLASGAVRPSPDALAEMMRVTHTLKGAAGTVGLHAIVDVSHRLEDVLAELAVVGRVPSPWTAQTGELLVEAIDALRGYLDHMTEPTAGQRVDALRAQLDRVVAIPRRTPSQPLAVVEHVLDAGSQRFTDAVPEPVAESVPEPVTESVPELVVDAMTDRESAAIPRMLADVVTRPLPDSESGAVSEAVPDAVTDAIPEAVSDALPDAGASPEPKPWLRVEPERIDALMSSAGELLFDRTRIERRAQLLRTLARDLARTRQALHDAIADDTAATAPIRAALASAEAELAGQATVLSQTTAGLLEEIEALRRTIGELQRGLTRIRMESARSLMAHAARTLRALRRATGVAVELRTVGEDTEFDKAVAELLVDPITQLLRNAVAHGVEPPDERAASGKPAVGTITIRARQDGSSLVLEVGDDGRGIDTAALSARLVAAGRWSEARARLASDADVHAALLDASVSSRDEADELAGRGVGLGVVRQTVAMLGGELTVASTPGKGTTFCLRLPLSTVLAHAMLFKVDGQVYAIPNLYVTETTQVGVHATTAIVGQDVLPVLRLEQLLGRAAATERRPALVVSFAGKSLVCTVDKIIGAREVIIKPLGPLLAPLTLYAGATISGSGKVQLILDPAQLVRRAHPSTPTAFVEPGSAPTVLAGRALVVDDSRAIREAMTSMLASEGWIVDVAEDGTRALQLARQLAYDLVITDLEMPEVGGFALIAQLRADDRFKVTPIIIITSRATPEHRRRARELGVNALIAKPITRRKLLEALAAR